MRLHRWLRPHRSVLVPLLAVTCLPAVALLWVSWRMVEQDRALASQRLQERLEHAAAAAVSALDRRLSASDAQLPFFLDAPPETLADGAVLLIARGDAVAAYPHGRVLWKPSPPPASPEPSPALWDAGERLEFQLREYASAAAEFRRLSRASEPEVRAGALIRLGRTLRKARRYEDALAAYEQLAMLGPMPVDGSPAELIATYGRALVLRERRGPGGADSGWRPLAAGLQADLQRGRWPISRAAYEFYTSELAGWLGASAPPPGWTDRFALSVAADLAWQRWQASEEPLRTRGRVIVDVDGWHAVVLWRTTTDGMTALVAGRDYVASEWRTGLGQPGVAIDLLEPAARPTIDPASERPFATAAAADTGLPWTLTVASVDPAADLAALAMPRRLMVTGLALIALVVGIGVYVVARAVTSELAVARLQSNFVAAVSHEFRSPVAALRHLTELLAGGGVSGEDRLRRYYAALASEAERLHRLVESLLDFGRMEAGRREYRFEPLDATALIEHVVSEFANADESAARRIEVAAGSLEPHERVIRGDGGALTRAVWNLVDNALKYAPPESPVRVALARDNGHLLIQVVDEGPGIAPDERADVFDRFVRGRAAATAHVGGTGLGLAIVRHIARAHGGDVTLDAGAGRGARFTIALPAEGPAGG